MWLIQGYVSLAELIAATIGILQLQKLLPYLKPGFNKVSGESIWLANLQFWLTGSIGAAFFDSLWNRDQHVQHFFGIISVFTFWLPLIYEGIRFLVPWYILHRRKVEAQRQLFQLQQKYLFATGQPSTIASPTNLQRINVRRLRDDPPPPRPQDTPRRTPSGQTQRYRDQESRRDTSYSMANFRADLRGLEARLPLLPAPWRQSTPTPPERSHRRIVDTWHAERVEEKRMVDRMTADDSYRVTPAFDPFFSTRQPFTAAAAPAPAPLRLPAVVPEPVIPRPVIASAGPAPAVVPEPVITRPVMASAVPVAAVVPESVITRPVMAPAVPVPAPAPSASQTALQSAPAVVALQHAAAGIAPAADAVAPVIPGITSAVAAPSSGSVFPGQPTAISTSVFDFNAIAANSDRDFERSTTNLPPTTPTTGRRRAGRGRAAIVRPARTPVATQKAAAGDSSVRSSPDSDSSDQLTQKTKRTHADSSDQPAQQTKRTNAERGISFYQSLSLLLQRHGNHMYQDMLAEHGISTNAELHAIDRFSRFKLNAQRLAIHPQALEASLRQRSWDINRAMCTFSAQMSSAGDIPLLRDVANDLDEIKRVLDEICTSTAPGVLPDRYDYDNFKATMRGLQEFVDKGAFDNVDYVEGLDVIVKRIEASVPRIQARLP